MAAIARASTLWSRPRLILSSGPPSVQAVACEEFMSAELNIYNPDELGPPMGQYTHVTRVKANEFLFIAGMLSGDSAGNVIGDGDFDAQTAQAFRESGGGGGEGG